MVQGAAARIHRGFWNATIAILALSGLSAAFSPLQSTPARQQTRGIFSTTTTTEIPATLPKNEDVRIVSSMPDPLPMDLKHDYYLLRHGQSTANVAAVISSDRSLAYSTRHGLTALGQEQGAGAAEALVNALEKNSAQKGDKIVFVSSPFARAKQTAEACLAELTANEDLQERVNAMGLEILTKDPSDILLRENLMERYFGRLDNEAIYTYAYVWPVDKFNVTHTAFEAESVAAVCTRLRELIVEDLERQQFASGSKCHVVMTSHADVLQICQLYGANAPNVGAFSSYRFGNGEVRAMARTPDSLPDPSPLEAPQRGTTTTESPAV